MTQCAASPATGGQQVEGAKVGDAFEMAASATLKAWTSTSLLSMTRQGQVSRATAAFASGSASMVTELLCEIAGPSFDGYAIKTGMDAARAMKLGSSVMRLICTGAAEAPEPSERVGSVKRIHQRAKTWIDAGELKDAPSDLQRISGLIGDSPEIRLALLAPFAPALATCGIVFRAQEVAYPFVPEQDHGPSSQ